MPGVPPVPIPNTVVKPRAANGSRTIGPARVGCCQIYSPMPSTGHRASFFQSDDADFGEPIDRDSRCTRSVTIIPAWVFLFARSRRISTTGQPDITTRSHSARIPKLSTGICFSPPSLFPKVHLPGTTRELSAWSLRGQSLSD